MAMTQLAVLFIATLAAIATAAMFVNVADRWTEVLIPFLASLLWGVAGLSSFDVHAQAFGNSAEPMLPLAYLAIGLAMATGVYGFADLIVGIGEQASEVDAGDMLR